MKSKKILIAVLSVMMIAVFCLAGCGGSKETTEETKKPVKKETDILNSIIWEESNAYFYGDKTLDETLRIIQNRCQLYLDENSN